MWIAGALYTIKWINKPTFVVFLRGEKTPSNGLNLFIKTRRNRLGKHH
ncbi:hypothetical protein PROSTU_00881 [Providencia stuartii ATCC 25827]|uniref:Uncharacterized protein n=1 Tax=Providencia stuartii ATCC 25827 TaxID=471874 RepID=A0AA86Z2J5_PROST|nr:hypothetical protein PROSTU_00881 [Providencia stuartii ATCC 25827]